MTEETPPIETNDAPKVYEFKDDDTFLIRHDQLTEIVAYLLEQPAKNVLHLLGIVKKLPFYPTQQVTPTESIKN